MQRGVDHNGAALRVPETVTEAAAWDQPEVACDLFRRGNYPVTPLPDGSTAFHWACWYSGPRFLALNQEVRRQKCVSYFELLSLLLQNSTVEQVRHGTAGLQETCAHWAAKSKNVTALRLLYRRDPGVFTMRDKEGMSVFLVAAQEDAVELLEYLYLQTGASVEEQDNLGRTALQYACARGHCKTVTYLLSRAASVAHRDHEGLTALHWAARKDATEVWMAARPVVDWLLAVGGHFLIDEPDGCGDTPMQIAYRSSNWSLCWNFFVAKCFYRVCGHPHIFQDDFAWRVAAVFFVNLVVVLGVILPSRIAVAVGTTTGTAHLPPESTGGAPPSSSSPGDIENPVGNGSGAFFTSYSLFEDSFGITNVVLWLVYYALTVKLWLLCWQTDPGCLAPNTILSQAQRIFDHAETFDADQVIGSQMTHVAAFRKRRPASKKRRPNATRNCLRALQDSSCGLGPLHGGSASGSTSTAGGITNAREQKFFYTPLIDSSGGDIIDGAAHLAGVDNRPTVELQQGVNSTSSPTVQPRRLNSEIAKYREDLYALYPTAATSIFVADENERPDLIDLDLMEMASTTAANDTPGNVSSANNSKNSAPIDSSDHTVANKKTPSKRQQSILIESVEHRVTCDVRGTAPSAAASSSKNWSIKRLKQQQLYDLLHFPDERRRKITVDDVLGALEDLYELERDLHQFNFQRQLLLPKDVSHVYLPAHVRQEQRTLTQETNYSDSEIAHTVFAKDLETLNDRIFAISADVGKLRRLLLELTTPAGDHETRSGKEISSLSSAPEDVVPATTTARVSSPAAALNGTLYLQKVLSGNFQNLNVTCRCLLTQRSKFWKEKCRVVERFDHHCPWVDNAIGLGNQRSFFLFLLSAFTLTLWWFSLFFDYLLTEIENTSGDVAFFFETGVVGKICLLASAVCNLGLLGFVALLLGRHVALMLADLTAFEYLNPERNPHVVQRYSGNVKGMCFLFQDLTPCSAVSSVYNYWTCSLDGDDRVFRQTQSSVSATMRPEQSLRV
ncbi:unnamed protein product [Amoebophrya sp. A120]|nr:unnamed protein product [Amoebophrya sp. A120]|eukprot:GSA120T00000472001.1